MMKVLLVALVALAAVQSAWAQPRGFIRVSDGKFVDEDCKDFVFVGANTWRMLESAANTTGVQLDGQNPAEWLMQTAAANNISVLRVFATGVSDELPMLLSPGEYNQKALEALDQVVDLAAKYKIRLTLVLVRTWNGPDNLAAFSSWTGTPIENFFTDPKAIDAFKNHISFMSNRTNSVNGVKYSDDPTIFSWNLMNEPRFFGNDTTCQSDAKKCQDEFQSWVEETSAQLKEAAPKQLVTIGYEGFFGTGSPHASANPAGDWPLQTGHDFERNFATKTLDYTEIHYWPNNWGIKPEDSSSFLNNWVDAHVAAAKSLKKPLVFEEFGKNTTNPYNDPNPDLRRKYFSEVFDKFTKSVDVDDGLRGVAYWMFDPILQNENSPGYEDFGQDQVPTTSPIFKEVIVPAARVASQHQGAVLGCAPGAPAPAPANVVAAGGRKMLAH